MINATKKWIFLKISGATLIPFMLWFIINLINFYDQGNYDVVKINQTDYVPWSIEFIYNDTFIYVSNKHLTLPKILLV